MSLLLSTHAKEKSTFIVTVTFTDEDDNVVIPNSITWSLADNYRNIVNEREDIVEVPDSSIDIVLSDDDLQILSSEANQGVRRLTVNAIYDSSLGEDLLLTDSIRFIIDREE